MTNNKDKNRSVYDIGISLRIGLNAHSMSNVGSYENVLLPRKVLLENGIEVDAISGGILKHHHAESMAFMLAASDDYLCPACQIHDSLRAAYWVNSPEYRQNDTPLTMELLLKCGLCDTHGFMIPKVEGAKKNKRKYYKDSVLNYSMGLAIPESFNELEQFHTRQTVEYNDAMIFIRPSRSGTYGLCIRYTAGWLGVDTSCWKMVMSDSKIREIRHKMIIRMIRDQLVSPRGANMASMLPHLTKLEGAVTIQLLPGGGAPIFSPLEDDYVQFLESFASSHIEVHTFSNVSSFNSIMSDLIDNTSPNSTIFEREQ